MSKGQRTKGKGQSAGSSRSALSSLPSSASPLITELFFKAVHGAIPDAGISVSQWADKYRYLSPERSARSGKWSTDLVPFTREIMDACSDPAVWKVVWVKPNQVAGTETANNVIGHRMHAKPSAVLYACENEDKAKAWSTECLAPMLRDTPVLAALVKEPRTRDSGNTIKAKKYPGGHLAIGWATSPATASSRPREVVILDEYDAYLPTKEGDYGELAILRTDTFEDKLILIVSTPRERLEPPPGAPIDAPRYSRIEREYEESDKRRYYVPCPHCKHFQTLRWEQVQWDDEPLLAYYICENEKCRRAIEEEDKTEMLARGRWQAEKEFRGVAGFHINKLYSPFVTWGEVAEKYLKAKRSGDPSQMRVWINTSLAEGWQDDEKKVETHALVERRENYYGTVPLGCLVLFCGVDVQANRLELQVRGWGLNNERWAIDYVIIEGDPAHASTWERLKLQLLRAWPAQQDPKLEFRILATCVDVGFHGDMVRRFCRENRGLRVFAVRGSQSPVAPLISRPSLWGRPPIKLFNLGTNVAKDSIFSGLLVAEPGPGYCHFPIEDQLFDEKFFKQLYAEQRKPVKRGGVIVRTYEIIRPGMRNEALDTWVYADGARAIVNPNIDAIAAAMAQRSEVRDQRSEESSPDSALQTPDSDEEPEVALRRANRQRRGRNFATDW